MFNDVAQQRTIALPEPCPGLLGRAMDHVRQFVCGLHGHDALLHFEHGRMSLQCTSCGYETPGWDLRQTSARRETQQESRPVARMPLVSHRRVA